MSKLEQKSELGEYPVCNPFQRVRDDLAIGQSRDAIKVPRTIPQSTLANVREGLEQLSDNNVSTRFWQRFITFSNGELHFKS